jgi:branched-chain amino acid transport system substrate-binding protein
MMRRLMWTVMAAVLCLVSGCGDDAPDAAATTLRIGLLVPLSGANQSIGTDLKYGFQLYVTTHAGRLGGHPVDLRLADEGDGAQTALPAATKLVKDDKVVVMTGVAGAGSVAAIAPVLTEARIPLVGAGGRPPLKDVTRIWHTSAQSIEPGAALAAYVQQQVNGPVYLFGPDYRDGYDMVRGFSDATPQIAGTQFTPFPATTDFTPYLNQVRASGARAVYAAYTGRSAVDFVRSYARSDAATLPLFGPGSLTEGWALEQEGAAAQGVVTAGNYAPDLDNAANRAFVSAWAAAHPGPPATPDAPVSTYAVAAWDAAAVLDHAIAAVGEHVSPEAVNDAIGRLGQIDSPRGPWQFNAATHTPVQQWYVRQVRPDGRALANVTLADLSMSAGG